MSNYTPAIGDRGPLPLWVEMAEALPGQRANWLDLRKAAVAAGYSEEAAGYHVVHCFDMFDMSLGMPDGTILDGQDAWRVMGEVLREERDDGGNIYVYYRLKEGYHEHL